MRRFGLRTERSEYTEDCGTQRRVRAVSVSLYEHSQIRIPTDILTWYPVRIIWSNREIACSCRQLDYRRSR